MMKALLALAATLAALAVSSADVSDDYEVVWIRQSLTHSGYDDTRTFQQRYLVGKRDATSSPSAIFFYTGNEGDVVSFWASCGFVRTLAAQFEGSMVVFGESRYYGASIPDGRGDYAYLSTELILADYAFALRNYFFGGTVPVIAFGGSYGGTLSTFFRYAYPQLVTGAVASSAPIGYYNPERWAEFNVSQNTFSDIVASNYASCLDVLNAARAAVENYADEAKLVDLFGACSIETLRGNSTSNAALFVYALESLPQLNYPTPANGYPANPCETLVCDAVTATDEDALVAQAADFTKVFFGVEGDCLPAFEEGPGGVPGDGPGLGAWGYQSCTENLHEFSAHSKIRTYDFNRTEQDRICLELYGVTPDTTTLTRLYGGYDLPNRVSNVFFSNGLLDPWHGGGFLPQFFPNVTENSFCVMPSAAHHLDLREPTEDDPADVVACRDAEMSAVTAWLEEERLESSVVVAQGRKRGRFRGSSSEN